MDFKWLKARVDILNAAREGLTAVDDDKVEKRLLLSLPPGTGFPRNPSGINSPIRVLMPVDKRLQERGEQWAKSESVEVRCLAPLALSHFRSDKTTAILWELTRDPLYRDIVDAQGKGTRFYPARWPAYRVLRRWGVAVEQPITEVALPLSSGSMWRPNKK
jgi:hypothetical protein